MASSKLKTLIRHCERCKAAFPADKAKCPSCNFWHLRAAGNAPKKVDPTDDQTVLLADVQGEEDRRYHFTGRMVWLNTIFGGGLVTNGVTLFAGKNGAGKSTVSLQLAAALVSAVPDRLLPNAKPPSDEVLYIGAEEGALAIKARGIRIGLGEALSKVRLHPVGSSADLGGIIMTRRPKAVFFDSLPAFVSDPEEAVELCGTLKEYALALDSPFVVIDHVTKSDDFAGLEKLQHKVDTCCIMFPVEDSRDEEMREIDVTKNRFGRANFTTRVRMTEKGIVYHESDQADDPALGGDDDEE